MKCKIDGCFNQIMYKKDNVCQKHYFRKMRYGTYELTSVRKYRIQNPAGYQKLHEPLHKLSDKDGYVYEHRMVYFDSGKQVANCEICGTNIDWKILHIDHINKDGSDNRIANLRLATRNQNNQNRKQFSNNSSGHTGIRWHKKDKLWNAYIGVNKKNVFLGGFKIIEDAITARKKAEKELFTHAPIG